MDLVITSLPRAIDFLYTYPHTPLGRKRHYRFSTALSLHNLEGCKPLVRPEVNVGSYPRAPSDQKTKVSASDGRPRSSTPTRRFPLFGDPFYSSIPSLYVKFGATSRPGGVQCPISLVLPLITRPFRKKSADGKQMLFSRRGCRLCPLRLTGSSDGWVSVSLKKWLGELLQPVLLR